MTIRCSAASLHRPPPSNVAIVLAFSVTVTAFVTHARVRIWRLFIGHDHAIEIGDLQYRVSAQNMQKLWCVCARVRVCIDQTLTAAVP